MILNVILMYISTVVPIFPFPTSNRHYITFIVTNSLKIMPFLCLQHQFFDFLTKISVDTSRGYQIFGENLHA